jgi:threonylcarbamoyladenosine tRNA methylthiotransferase MtaB
MKKVSFYTLGCKLNYAETSSIQQQFIRDGYSVVDFGEDADVCVVNTCTVTERADRECRQIIRRAQRKSPSAYVVVLGCYAQLSPEEIASIEGVDLVLGAGEKFDIFRYAEGFEKRDAPRIHVAPITTVNDFGIGHSGVFSDRTRAFLKIQDGCDYTCSFCTIPLARGKSRSQGIGPVTDQALELIRLGFKEIILTGVNIGDYGCDRDTSLLELLKNLTSLEGLERIRISSVEPNLLTGQLLDYWMASEKICNHFHIPLQAASDDLLRTMRRRYTMDDYSRLLDDIVARDPSAGIGVDVIVGFPGETEDIFNLAYAALHALPATYLHVFTYSERPNTPSLNLDGRVEPRVRYKRSEMLRILSRKKREAFYQSQLNRVLPVLLENTIENNMLSGYTDTYIRVSVPYRQGLENSIVRVRLTALTEDGCHGTVLESGMKNAC